MTAIPDKPLLASAPLKLSQEETDALDKAAEGFEAALNNAVDEALASHLPASLDAVEVIGILSFGICSALARHMVRVGFVHPMDVLSCMETMIDSVSELINRDLASQRQET